MKETMLVTLVILIWSLLLMPVAHLLGYAGLVDLLMLAALVSGAYAAFAARRLMQPEHRQFR